MVYILLVLLLVEFVAGVPTSKEDVGIIGGDDIPITDAPYQVSLLYLGSHSCGGAIVSNDIVVTAAHCVNGRFVSDFQVRVGSSYRSRGGYVVPVGDLIWKSGFSNKHYDNDIAILWLAFPLAFSDFVKPVAMIEAGEEISDGELTVVTGWGNTLVSKGYSESLKRVLVPKVNETVCSEAYRALFKITPRMICAAAPEGGKDACQGDSGGPLVYNGKLAGVVSFGVGCGRPKYPGVYAKVSALRDWVDENITYLRMKHNLREVS